MFNFAKVIFPRSLKPLFERAVILTLSLTLTAASANAGVTVFRDRAVFNTAAGATRTIDFSTTDSGSPITDPPSQTGFDYLGLSGVCFQSVVTYYNRMIYTFSGAVIRVNLPPGTYAMAVDLGHFYPVGPGTFTITLSTGDTYNVPYQPATIYPWPYLFFGFISDAPISWATFSLDNTVLTMDDFSLTQSAGSVPGCPPPADSPPVANAGSAFSVDEGQSGVVLNGSLSNDPNGDALSYAWEQVGDGSTLVALSGTNTSHPTFTAPFVALGGETLTFRLTVTANGEDSTDTVSVTVVNVNHPPVADAGGDQRVAEGSLVTLQGGNSFDIDTDAFTYTWVQVDNGAPTVTLTGADPATPSFTAPYAGSGGGVATLVFELTVDDGFEADAPAPGYTLANVVDTVTVEITNTNNAPIAMAGDDQTVNENGAVSLTAAMSKDPDSDTLAYSWVEVGGATVVLSDATTATPSFTAPFVSAGGADLTFVVTVNDGYGGTDTAAVVVHVQNVNDPPLASAARPTVASLWPPNHRMVAVGITGVTDPNNNATITITGVTQDEPTNGLGDGDTAIDAVINADGTVLLRAERSGTGNGRVYRISFTASDYEGSTSGVVFVTVPHSMKKPAIDSGGIFDSTQ